MHILFNPGPAPQRPKLNNTPEENRRQEMIASGVLTACQSKYNDVPADNYTAMNAMNNMIYHKMFSGYTNFRDLPVRTGDRIPDDCVKSAELVQQEFDKMGIKALNIYMDMHTPQGLPRGGHVFTITNFPEKIMADAPPTWGEDAIITDLYSGISMKKADAIEFYNSKYGIDFNKSSFYAAPANGNPIQQRVIDDMKVERVVVRE